MLGLSHCRFWSKEHRHIAFSCPVLFSLSLLYHPCTNLIMPCMHLSDFREYALRIISMYVTDLSRILLPCCGYTDNSLTDCTIKLRATFHWVYSLFIHQLIRVWHALTIIKRQIEEKVSKRDRVTESGARRTRIYVYLWLSVSEIVIAGSQMKNKLIPRRSQIMKTNSGNLGWPNRLSKFQCIMTRPSPIAMSW